MMMGKSCNLYKLHFPHLKNQIEDVGIIQTLFHEKQYNTVIKYVDFSAWVQMIVLLFFLFGFFLKDFTYLYLERGEGREKEEERNIDVRENHLLVAFCTHPNRGLDLQPRHVP